jgi:HK97 gp10 family phage protein
MSTFVYDDKVLQRLIREAPEMVDKAIRATAFDVEAQAKELAAVDTGAMRASIFTKTSKGSNAPSELPADKEFVDPTPGDPPLMTAYIAPGVEYAAYVEFGTGKAAAQPFMTPAIENADKKFETYIKKVFA